MNKKEFIKILDKKLSGISEHERLDIINEYSLTIDESILSGKSEEEAVLGFGDINVFVSEIIDTYKNDKSYFVYSIKNKIIYKAKKTKNLLKINKLNNKNQDDFNIQYDKDVIELDIQKNNIFTRFIQGINATSKKILDMIINLTKFFIKEFINIGSKLVRGMLLGTVAVSSLLLGFSVILTFSGFPTIGLTIAFLGGLLAIVSLLNKTSIIYAMLSLAVMGSGTAIFTMELFSLEQINYSDYLVLDKSSHTETHVFNPENTLIINKSFYTDTEIIYDDSMPKGEFELNTEVDDNHMLVVCNVTNDNIINNTNTDIVEDTNTINNINTNITNNTNAYIYGVRNDDYEIGWFKDFFWNLKEKKILIFNSFSYLEKMQIRVNSDTEVILNN